jgi:hypothetical protein
MSEFNVLDLSELYDLLAAYTTTYTKMLALNLPPSPEYLYTKEIIERLQLEIQTRTSNIEVKKDELSDGLMPAIA